MPRETIPRRVVGLRIVRRLPPSGPGFLSLFRAVLRNEYESGESSAAYRYEMVERRGIDSVAIMPFFRGASPVRVLVKAGFRPALFLRGSRPAPGEPARKRSWTVEAVAGSLEPGETSVAQIRRRAARELREETGYRVRPEDFRPLGAGFFPSHGQCTEKIHLFAVCLDHRAASLPKGDGSINEAETWSLLLGARDLIARCRTGEIEDPKLEIGVVRLLEHLRRRGRGGLA
ncbi:MAG TPA: NUDIX domain-containing protein [Candidatus Polarisedimenticolia bacterium]|nr:NUDIX domain-containing protein [Candidatus Polarisedimenticolia bacterium]